MICERRSSRVLGELVGSLLLVPALALATLPIVPSVARAAPPEAAEVVEVAEVAEDDAAAPEGEDGAGEVGGDPGDPGDVDATAGDEPGSEPESDVEAEPDPEPEPEPEVAPDVGPEAEPEDDANKDPRTLFGEGQDAYDLGKYGVAVAKFELAFELSSEPALLFNIGQAYWQWYSIEPDIEHLRKARKLFENYDRQMRGREDYVAGEVDGFIEALTNQIVAAEEAERMREALLNDDPEARRAAAEAAERRRRTNKALTISGSILITLGALGVATGLGGLATRGITGFQLDEANKPGTSNPNTAEQEANLRNAYSLGGTIAFSALIAGGAVLPVGIALRVVGGQRSKRDEGGGNKKVALAPAGSLLRIEF